MTDNNKYIPKLPETKTEIVLNQEQQNLQEPKSTAGKVVEAVKETVVPAVYASDRDSEQKEGAKKAIGYTLAGVDAANLPLGAAATGAAAITGGIQEGIGKMVGNEEMAEGGRVLREGSTQPIGDLKEGAKKNSE